MTVFENYQQVKPKISSYFHKYVFQNKSLFEFFGQESETVCYFCDNSLSYHFMSWYVQTMSFKKIGEIKSKDQLDNW